MSTAFHTIYDVAALISQGHAPGQRPAIFPVRRPAALQFPSIAQRQAERTRRRTGEIIRCTTEPQSQPGTVLLRTTREFQDTLIDEINGAVRTSAPGVRNGIDNKSEAIFAACKVA